jgi:Na+/H+-dicarboxylate symporter
VAEAIAVAVGLVLAGVTQPAIAIDAATRTAAARIASIFTAYATRVVYTEPRSGLGS